MKKVAILGIQGVPAKYGGYETLVDNLLNAEGLTKYQVYVFCSSKDYSKTERKKYYKASRLIYLPLKGNGYQAILFDNLCVLLAVMKKCDIILSLGTAGSLGYSIVKSLHKGVYLTNVDGQDHKRERFSLIDKIFLSKIRLLAYRCSDFIISDNRGIHDLVPDYYKKRSVIIPYGGDQVIQNVSTEVLVKYNLNYRDYYFKVARIVPENNIEMILSSFEGIDSKIVIVGNWNNSQYGSRLKEKYGNVENVILLDPIYDQFELDGLRGNCKAYVHGHSRGGTNPSLVEAMNLGLPIFSFDVNFNRFTLNEAGFYFSSSAELCDLIKNKTNDELIDESRLIKSVALKYYTWPKVSDKYIELFNSCT